jgi:hypothetical protein
MRVRKSLLRRRKERGVIITLVAIFMLGIVGAMAALSIDVVTLYTARSEAQLAADGAALAAARVLANSGMTSTSDVTVGINAIPMATAVATQVAANNLVGGRDLNPAGASPCTGGQEICVSINQSLDNSNPQVTVTVQRADLPTFFARIWGKMTVAVKASATAEAYNPSHFSRTGANPALPVAPMCVKPWLVPNISPAAGTDIFDRNSGAIIDTGLLGWQTSAGNRLKNNCNGVPCNSASPAPTAWNYYPGDPGDFPAPNATSVACTGCGGLDPYQLSVAGCVQTPISCSSTVKIDAADVVTDAQTRRAVDGLTQAANGGDTVNVAAPFQFTPGLGNPGVVSGPLTQTNTIMVSNSLVTVPVFDNSTWPVGFPSVKIIGFVQLFLNPSGTTLPFNGIPTQVVNLVGCGNLTGQPILGNGSSAVAVRLISP